MQQEHVQIASLQQQFPETLVIISAGIMPVIDIRVKHPRLWVDKITTNKILQIVEAYNTDVRANKTTSRNEQ